jgi:hypothetical protein
VFAWYQAKRMCLYEINYEVNWSYVLSTRVQASVYSNIYKLSTTSTMPIAAASDNNAALIYLVSSGDITNVSLPYTENGSGPLFRPFLDVQVPALFDPTRNFASTCIQISRNAFNNPRQLSMQEIDADPANTVETETEGPLVPDSTGQLPTIDIAALFNYSVGASSQGNEPASVSIQKEPQLF